MKSQDLLLLLKLISLEKADQTGDAYLQSQWQDWETEEVPSLPDMATATPLELDELHLKPLATHEHSSMAQYGIRALAEMTGISKTQVSLSLGRCYQNGLALPDRLTGVPKVNRSALGEFIVHGLRYVFPVTLGAVTRGIATAWAAPILSSDVLSSNDLPPVWPDPRGKTRGQSLEPLYKTVPMAVRKDPTLYSLLALSDAIRIGMARERGIARELLMNMLESDRV